MCAVVGRGAVIGREQVTDNTSLSSLVPVGMCRVRETRGVRGVRGDRGEARAAVTETLVVHTSGIEALRVLSASRRSDRSSSVSMARRCFSAAAAADDLAARRTARRASMRSLAEHVSGSRSHEHAGGAGSSGGCGAADGRRAGARVTHMDMLRFLAAGVIDMLRFLPVGVPAVGVPTHRLLQVPALDSVDALEPERDRFKLVTELSRRCSRLELEPARCGRFELEPPRCSRLWPARCSRLELEPPRCSGLELVSPPDSSDAVESPRDSNDTLEPPRDSSFDCELVRVKTAVESR